MLPRLPTAVDAFAGSKLRTQRRTLGMSQSKVADALGVSHQQIHMFEKGNARISASRLHSLASLLGVPISFFFADEPNDKSPVHTGLISGSKKIGVKQNVFAPDSLALIGAFFKIRDLKMRRAIMALVKAVAADDHVPIEMPLENEDGLNSHLSEARQSTHPAVEPR